MSHTNGPWIKTSTNIITTKNGGYIAKVDSGINDDPNAQLIAAAPDLLNALLFAKDLLDQCQTLIRQSNEASKCLLEIESAISKATGPQSPN